MSRPFTPKVVTGNALRDGDAVWLTEDDRWTRSMDEAELIEDEAVAQLRLLYGQAQDDRVVGVYLAEARAGRRGPEPTHLRESIRSRGPSAGGAGPRAPV